MLMSKVRLVVFVEYNEPETASWPRVTKLFLSINSLRHFSLPPTSISSLAAFLLDSMRPVLLLHIPVPDSQKGQKSEGKLSFGCPDTM